MINHAAYPPAMRTAPIAKRQPKESVALGVLLISKIIPPRAERGRAQKVRLQFGLQAPGEPVSVSYSLFLGKIQGNLGARGG